MRGKKKTYAVCTEEGFSFSYSFPQVPYKNYKSERDRVVGEAIV